MSPTIESLEGKVWPEPEFRSSFDLAAHALRKKPLNEITPGELRVAFSDDVGADWLKTRVLEVLGKLPEINATYFPGDLLLAVMRSRQFQSDEEFRSRIVECADRALKYISDPKSRDQIQALKKG